MTNAPDSPHDDPEAEEFVRVVGRRLRPAAGGPPPATTRSALAAMAQYRTAAPKGVFIYRSHEEANADRERWTVDAVVERQTSGLVR